MRKLKGKESYLRKIDKVTSTCEVREVIRFNMLRLEDVTEYTFHLLPCGHKYVTNTRGHLDRKQIRCEQCIEEAGEGFLLL
jgi:hypothetical protein